MLKFRKLQPSWPGYKDIDCCKEYSNLTTLYFYLLTTPLIQTFAMTCPLDVNFPPHVDDRTFDFSPCRGQFTWNLGAFFDRIESGAMVRGSYEGGTRGDLPRPFLMILYSEMGCGGPNFSRGVLPGSFDQCVKN